jgi:nuclear GTP-binding protein
VAPIPGETKVWQYIALMKRIFLIDCPGVVYDDGDDETEIVLKVCRILQNNFYIIVFTE